ncbi:MAG TPA: M1 family metallopeptidase [Candidatus Acidoferrales bacterium]|nr:M1 family metallopeptidase [Candidatus Acidoferrales bacterium]
MPIRRILEAALVVAALCVAPISGAKRLAPPQNHATAEAPANAEPKPLSTRVVAYQIQATLVPREHKINASETLTYKNLTGQPQQTFPFHLYLNAFQPQSTFMTEVRLDGTRGSSSGTSWDPKHYGSETVTRLEVDGMGDVTKNIHFIHPDDNNTQDRTVFQVTLPTPVAPGASVTFRMDFVDVMPEVVERTGYKRDFYMVGQWFPKIGVWWKNQWNCHQFHAATEFFADFGTFDVKVTVPQDDVVGAAGDLVSSTNNSGGTKTLTFHSEDVHDFSWTASPHFTDVEDFWTGSAGTVRIHLLMSPGNMATAPRYLQALKGTLAYYDKNVGPYPYDRITVVDPPHGALDAGGMEYPTLITAGTAWWMPKGLLTPEVVVAHEFGHQYWYGMVATNEFEEAWLDEGINSYEEVKVMDALYGPKTSVINFPFAQMGDAESQRVSYLSMPDYDPLTRFAWQFVGDQSYGGITYGKTATVLLTLEKLLGENKMRDVMHQYFMRYRFTHPTGADFLKTIDDVSGQNLDWYFNQAVSGTNVLDYEIRDVRSDPVKWYESVSTGPRVYRSYVTVHRKGDFVFPVDVKVTFDDKSSTTEHWDGRDRWIRYTYERSAKVAAAQIDPDHKVWLDRNFFNNSRTVSSYDSTTHKLLNIWVFVNEWISQLVAWIA